MLTVLSKYAMEDSCILLLSPKANLKKLVVSGSRVAKTFHTREAEKQFFNEIFDISLSLC